MNLFFVNDFILKKEKEIDCNAIIEQLENLYIKNKNITFLNTLMAYSWYYFIEGDIGQAPINYQSEILLKKWKQYTYIGLSEYNDKYEFCLIAGYILMMHGFYLDSSYEKIGIALLKKCANCKDNEDIKELSKYWLSNEQRNKYKNFKVPDLKRICNNLFNSETLLDKYFNEILSKNHN